MTGPLHARVYGLLLASDHELPGFVVGPIGEPHITITRAPEADFAEARRACGPVRDWFAWTRLDDGADYLQWRGSFEFLVSPDGRSIRGHAIGDVHPETYAVYLLNHALSFAAIKLGLEPIHATVVQVGSGALALCGPPGAGKTALAAALLSTGDRLVTDDFLVVRWEGDRALAQAGPPRLKMLPDTAERFLPDLARGVAMNPDTHKRIVALPERLRSQEEVPVRLIAMLRAPRPGRVVLRVSAPRAAMLDLVANTFNPVVTTRDRLRAQFGADARLAKTVPCVSVSAPRNWNALDTIAQRLRRRMEPSPQ